MLRILEHLCVFSSAKTLSFCHGMCLWEGVWFSRLWALPTGGKNLLTLTLSHYPQITPSSNMNPSMGHKTTVGDSVCPADGRLLFEKFMRTVEIIGPRCLLGHTVWEHFQRGHKWVYWCVRGAKIDYRDSYVENSGSQLDCTLDLPGGLLKKYKGMALSL